MPGPRHAHPRLAVVLALAIGVAWSFPARWLMLLCLREMYRLGEKVGITPVSPAPGWRLAGQVMGFNYSQPPEWYYVFAHAVAATAGLAPGGLAALWVRRRLVWGGWNWRPMPPRLRLAPTRAVLFLMLAGCLYTGVEFWCFGRIAEALLWLGERLGGSVVRIGVMGMGTNGPFIGGRWIDAVGNVSYRWGPHVIASLMALAVTLVIDSWLWRRDCRATIAERVCLQCGYDLSGTSEGLPCPECGRAAGSR